MRTSSRRRVLDILHRRGAGQVAYDALRAAPVLELLDRLPLSDDWREYLREGDLRYLSLQPSSGDREVFGRFLPGLPDEAEVSCWGIGRVAMTTAEGYHAGHRYWHPLADVDDLDGLAAYPFPDLAAPRSLDDLRAEVEALQARGFAVVGQMSQTILETAYLMRGIERLLTDLHTNHGYVDLLFAKLAEQRVAQARRFALAGVDVLRIGDDIATQEGLLVSPKLYRERIKAHHAAVVAAAREIAPDLPVLYHSDGSLTELLPDLLDLGVTAINPVQPECMDALAVQQHFGDRLALWGCTPVQSLFAHGSAEEVRGWTRFLTGEVAAAQGVIVQFINIVLTPTVLCNLGVFFEELARSIDEGGPTCCR
jgi:uroporphyrinogen decarboxylase